jgi:hypothetical protein
MAPDAEERPDLLSAAANEVTEGTHMRSAGSRADTAPLPRRSGLVTIRALAWFIARARSPAALRLATMRAPAAPSRPFGGPRPGRTGQPGGADRVQGAGLALPAAVLPNRSA